MEVLSDFVAKENVEANIKAYIRYCCWVIVSVDAAVLRFSSIITSQMENNWNGADGNLHKGVIFILSLTFTNIFLCYLGLYVLFQLLVKKHEIMFVQTLTANGQKINIYMHSHSQWLWSTSMQTIL